jgi:hypothetical protein
MLKRSIELRSQIGLQVWKIWMLRWKLIVLNIKVSAKENLGYYELKKHKPWFNKVCSKLLDQSKQVKLQWLRDQSKIKGDNLNKVTCEESRHFRNKKREYLRDKIKELAMKSKNKNIRDLYRGINDFKRGCKPRNNNILNRLLNVHNVFDVRQIEVHTAEPLITGPSHLQVQIAIGKLKKYVARPQSKFPTRPTANKPYIA